MQKSSCFHAELLEQRIVLQDKVECKVIPLNIFLSFTFLKLHIVTVYRPYDVRLEVNFSVWCIYFMKMYKMSWHLDLVLGLGIGIDGRYLYGIPPGQRGPCWIQCMAYVSSALYLA